MLKTNSQNESKMAVVGYVNELTQHTIAKNLVSVCVVGANRHGYISIMRKQDVKLGDKVVLFKPNAILPKKRWSKFLYDRYGTGRVRHHSFRKIYSECVALPIKSFPELRNKPLRVSEDVSRVLNVTEYKKSYRKIPC